MNKAAFLLRLYFLIVSFSSEGYASTFLDPFDFEIKTVQDLADRCFSNYPEFFNHNTSFATILSSDEIKKAFDLYQKAMKNWKPFNNVRNWSDYVTQGELAVIPDKFFALDSTNKGYELPYVMREEISDNSEVLFVGDIHGSIQSLVRILLQLIAMGYLNNKFQIIKHNFFMVFLGDCVDRGFGGIEVLYALMRIKLANWNSVFLMRGNHESESLSARYGFYTELKHKYPATNDMLKKQWLRWTGFLPFALFLKTNVESKYLHISHGGIGYGYDVRDDIESKKRIAEVYQAKDKFFRSGKKFQKIWLSKGRIQGFNWTDFKGDDSPIHKFNERRGAGLAPGFKATERYLDDNEFVAVFRGHEDRKYGLKMFSEIDTSGNREPGRYWRDVVKDGPTLSFGTGFNIKDYFPVYTFTTASSTRNYNLKHDFFGILHMKGERNKWVLYPYEFNIGTEIVRNRKWVQAKMIVENNGKQTVEFEWLRDIRGRKLPTAAVKDIFLKGDLTNMRTRIYLLKLKINNLKNELINVKNKLTLLRRKLEDLKTSIV